MSFLEEELRNFTHKSLIGVLGTGNRNTTPDNIAWYEEPTSSGITVLPKQIAAEFDLIPPAPNISIARSNAASNSNIIADHSLSGNAIHCTPSPNGKVFYITTTYGDMNTRTYNWIMPQMIPRTDSGFEGHASIGYTMRLYQGNPASGGVEIPTTQDQIGAIAGWFVHYGIGAIVVSSSFSGITNPNDMWVTGFRYIGKTGSDVDNADNVTLDKSSNILSIKNIDYIIDGDEKSIDSSDTPMSDPHKELITRAFFNTHSSLTVTPQIDTFTITSTDITNQYFTLTQTINNSKHNSVNLRGSILLEGPSYDYTIDIINNRINITANAIDEFVIGDILQVKYYY